MESSLKVALYYMKKERAHFIMEYLVEIGLSTWITEFMATVTWITEFTATVGLTSTVDFMGNGRKENGERRVKKEVALEARNFLAVIVPHWCWEIGWRSLLQS